MINENGSITDQYRNFIALSRYARWLPEQGRRETWRESVERLISYWEQKFPELITGKIRNQLYEAVLNHEVMPSMRSMATAGTALDRDNIAGYNCSYITVSRQRAFDEIMYVLLCGTGVGFSCERQYVNQLPVIAEEMYDSDTTIVVSDSKIGWATALRELISLLYSGKIPRIDYSKIRPAGTPLKTFGGRASGPDPLEELFRFIIFTFRHAIGRKLTSIEVHDIVCKIAQVVVVGGVRRSALISLSNLSDTRMRDAKSGAWWEANVQRALANNSIAYTEKPDVGTFMKEWVALYDSKSGERGIFNRDASKRKASENGRRDAEHDFGTNPCSEIILRDRQVCNLSEVVVRSGDSFNELKRKVRLATILGTLQATLTNFRYLSRKWKENTEEERLLGVSLTGIMDHEVLSGQDAQPGQLSGWLQLLKQEAIDVNKVWSRKLGIEQSTAITCVKPSGTVSQLVDAASGIHPRYSRYYIRTVRADKKDPLAQLMVDQGVPHEDDISAPDKNYVFSFPIAGPSTGVFRDDRTAIEQLEHWLLYAKYWCEHKPSVTVYVKEHEWPYVGAWVWAHFDDISGVSFLPHSEHTYQQAPYQEITKSDYERLVAEFPKELDWMQLDVYEASDHTASATTAACSGGSCEIVDLT